MLDWFANAATSITVARDISQSLITLRDAELVRSKVFDLTNSLMELQQQLMNAQMEQMGLIQQVAQLQESIRVANMQNDANGQYERHQFITGTFAYTLKPEFKTDKPEHFLCSRCFESNKHVTLHTDGACLHCPDCKHSIRIKPREYIKVPETLR